MIVIRCTAKLRKVGRWKVDEPTADFIDPNKEWYANLMWFDQRKCILFTHAATLFTVFVPDVLKKDLDDFRLLLEEAVFHQLMFDGIDLNDAAPVLGIAAGPAVIGVARNRSILGSMTDQAFQYTAHLNLHGGLGAISSRIMSRRVNNCPMRAINMMSPQNALRELLGYPQVRGFDW